MLKKISTGLVVMLALVLLASCKPSDKYAGDWHAVSKDGEKVKINFSKEKTMTLTDEAGNEENYELNQTAAGFQNNVGYYRVEIDNLSHYVIFENRKDESNAILAKQTNVASDFEDFVGEIIYTMNRDSYPDELR
ncbi:hypothetical protein JSQ81_13040 [Sporosarcina sp. Marseille-Q4063]|uniref:hypothetical protein n=1 Tax=Sporosarcina sp. Marseille-Q4063 TaxID=2810514 RepID=UPI001BB07453|nr:hypothetical protein [Sporosarcina sp. Marseille-Q4063]QUW20743.1 hypothetical protein JSQ81_13040 [Sporosarcina sp. Marseille-Q4063]